MQEISCILCHTKNSKIAITENGYTGRACDTCSLIYISPRPEESTIHSLYRHDQAYVPATLHIGQSTIKKLQSAHHLALIQKYKKSGTLLEIGSGAGFFLQAAAKKGFTPLGVEPNECQASFIQQLFAFPCYTGLFDSQAFPGHQFDIIYHCDVASHFYDPVTSFALMHERLTADGILCFETGNIGEMDPFYYDLFDRFQYPDHLFFFSKKSIIKLLEKTGFKILDIYSYSLIYQLTLNRFLKKFFYKPTSKLSHMQCPKSTQTPPAFSQSAIRRFYSYIQHTTRYSFGKFLVNDKRPQALIIIASKS